MKIFTAQQIREGDQYTIQNEPIQSIDLMERAASQCVEWLTLHFNQKSIFYVFCGVGNNGGDGFAIARLLLEKGYMVKTYTLLFSHKFSADCEKNKANLEAHYPNHCFSVENMTQFPSIPKDAILIDAIFGTGLNRPLKGFVEEIVLKLNSTHNTILSIDMPSGLQAEENNLEKVAVQASYTLSFQFNKLAFFFKENQKHIGEVHLLDINILPDYINATPTSYYTTSKNWLSKQYKKRNNFSHKGTYGHSLLMVGSYGKIGAAVLATKANIHSGSGLTSVHIPKCGYIILQSTVPEAMCICDYDDLHLSGLKEKKVQWDAIGIGPGIGMKNDTKHFLKSVLQETGPPMIIDADALNIIGKEKKLLHYIPHGSILTPHPKEFERLFGPTDNSFERLQLQIQKSKELKITILLKGHHTSISTPDGKVWFNITGNAGMATGGSGDILTGLITGLLAQGYAPSTAAIMGAWIHGKAADLALKTESMESLTASGIINYFGAAFKAIAKNK